jgi:tRNA/tmRNA/rRNA uracil-C5-methylase (TrmA/RlmC/RlmD family)
MKASATEIKYVEWLNAEVMHNASRSWLSELMFIKDEQLFFDDLIKSYTLQLIDSKYFAKSKKIVERLSHLQKDTSKIIEKVKKHERALNIMLDKIDQLEEEENYKKEHRNLIILVTEFFQMNQSIKKHLFKLIKGIIKEKKQKLLLN